MTEQELVFNGIDGSTGAYLQTPQSTADFAAVIRNEPEDLDDEEDVKLRSGSAEAHFGTGYGIDPDDLAQAGWGVIFAEGATTEVVEALSPLLELRKEQAGERFREYRGESAPDPKETKQRWLARHKMGAGPANPAKVPYYLLLVGDPTALPYQFQYQLDVQYAVGRISFDTADEYARYAQSIVDAERGGRVKSRSNRAIRAKKSGGRCYETQCWPISCAARDRPFRVRRLESRGVDRRGRDQEPARKSARRQRRS